MLNLIQFQWQLSWKIKIHKKKIIKLRCLKNTHVSKLNNNSIPKILCLTKMDTEREKKKKKKKRKAFLKGVLENNF